MKSVLTADIKKSTRMKKIERKKIQSMIFKTIDVLEKERPNDIFSTSMTTGDEFQIVLNNPKNSYDIYKMVYKRLEGKIYAGLGFGEIDIVEDRTKPSEMFGTAFYNARNAIEKAKLKNIDIIFHTGDEDLDFELNTITQLASFIQNKMTTRQLNVLNYIDSKTDTLQKDIALHFGVSDAAISKMIKTSGYELLLETEILIKKLLRKYCQDLN